MRKEMIKGLSRRRAIHLALILIVMGTAGCSGKDGSDKKESIMTASREPISENIKRVGAADIASAILTGEYDRLYAQFSGPLKELVPLREFRSMGKEFVTGIETFRPTSTIRLNGYDSRVWFDDTGRKGLSATMDDKGTITGIRILPHSSHPESDKAYSKTIFDFPFAGEWLVFWGGQNILDNYHYEFEPVRYAYDFVKEKNGFSYESDPKRNESYFAFDQDVLAPADGVVAAAVDGIPDNEPGKVDESRPAGNMVIIQHSNGEFSTIAHLKNGSVLVKAGDKVTAGQIIGKCGNSGNSTEPHIHFQVSSAADVEAASMSTIPISFKQGKKPVRGERIGDQIK